MSVIQLSSNPNTPISRSAELQTIDIGGSITHTHLEVDVIDLDKYTQAEVDALLAALPAGVSFGLSGEIPYMNPGGTDYLYAAGMAFDGTNLNVSGLKLPTGATVNEIETVLTDDDTHLPTSGAVVDAIAAVPATAYGTTGQMPYTNATGDGFLYSAAFTYAAGVLTVPNLTVSALAASATAQLVYAAVTTGVLGSNANLTWSGTVLHATGIELGTGSSVDTIETTLTDDDTHLPTSGAVFDAVAAVSSLSTGLDGEVPYMNVAGTDLEYHNNFKWEGASLRLTYSSTSYWQMGGTLDIKKTDLNIQRQEHVYNASNYIQHLSYRYGGTRAVPLTAPTDAKVLEENYWVYDGTSIRAAGTFGFMVDGAIATDDFNNKFYWELKEGAVGQTEKMRLDSTGLVVQENIYAASGFITTAILVGSATTGIQYGLNYISATLSSTVRMYLNPAETDGVSAIAYTFDTTNALATAGAKLVSVNNNGSEKFYIDRNGNVDIAAGAVYSVGGVPIGGGTAISLGSEDEIPHMDAAGTDFDYDSAFKWTGTNLQMGSATLLYANISISNPGLTLYGNAGTLNDWRTYSNTAGVTNITNKNRYGGTVAAVASAPTSAIISSTVGQVWDGTALRSSIRENWEVDGVIATDNFNTLITWDMKEGAAAISEVMRLDSVGVLTIQGNFILQATNDLYLDGGTDTYITESTANTIGVVAGGTQVLAINATSVGVDGNLSSITDSTDDLGSATIAWANLYVDHIQALDGSASNGQALTVYGGDADGTGNDGGHVTIKGGDAILADGTSTPGNLFLSPGNLYATSASATVYLGNPAYNGASVILQTTGTNTNVNLLIRSKGAGSSIQIGDGTIGSIILYDPVSMSDGTFILGGSGNDADFYVNPSIGAAGHTLSISAGAAPIGDYAGGALTLKSGAGQGTANGGAVYIYGGAALGTGSQGQVYLGTGAAGALSAKSSETNVVYYDPTTGLLTYGVAGTGSSSTLVSYTSCTYNSTTNITVGTTASGDVTYLIHFIAERNTGSGIVKASGNIEVLYDDTSGTAYYTSDNIGVNLGFSITADVSAGNIRLNIIVDNSVANNLSFDHAVTHKFYE